jgi:integrase
MAGDYKKTNYPGVEYKEHKTRRNGPRADRYFTIRYKVDGKTIRECLGWASDGFSAAEASDIRSMIKKNRKLGVRPQSLEEKRQMDAELREQEIAEAGKRKTFAEAARRYIEEYSLPNKASAGHEQARLRDYLLPDLGEKLLEDVTPHDVARIKLALQEAGRSASTVKQVLALIRQIINYSRTRGWHTGENPVRKVKMPKINNQRVRYLSDEEEAEFFAEAAKVSKDLHDMCLVSLYSGLRMGEVFALQQMDVDLGRKSILVRGLDHERGPKSGYNRTVPISDRIEALLKERCAIAQDASALLFPKEDGSMRIETGSTFYTVLRHLGWNDGITDRRLKMVPHVLRHTFASRLIRKGVALPVVQKLLGHSTIQMTMRYVQVEDDQCRSAIDAL